MFSLHFPWPVCYGLENVIEEKREAFSQIAQAWTEPGRTARFSMVSLGVRGRTVFRTQTNPAHAWYGSVRAELSGSEFPVIDWLYLIIALKYLDYHVSVSLWYLL